MLKTDRKIAVIGLGYVGFPLFKNLSNKLSCWGVDSDSSKIVHLKREFPQLMVTSNWMDVKDCDFYIVTVPTPIDKNNCPDVTPLKVVCGDLANVISREDIIVFESTVYPGATEELCIPILETLSGLKINKDFYVGYSPERINVGDKTHQLHNTSKIVSATEDKTCDLIKGIYESILSAEVHPTSSIKVAEAAKMYENVQRDVLIALANEFAEYCRLEGIDIKEVTECASSKWNFSKVNPGLVGGHCIAVDPYYLIDRASQKGMELSLVKTAREINELKPETVATRIEKVLGNQGKDIESLRILFLGITYKPNIADCRNTKIPNIIHSLENKGITTDVYDPIADKEYLKAEYHIRLITEQELKQKEYDIVIRMVNHAVFEPVHFENSIYLNLNDLL